MDIERILTDAQYERARGLTTTDAQALTEHLVEALARVSELKGEAEDEKALEGQVEDLERDLETVTEERDDLEDDLEDEREKVGDLEDELGDAKAAADCGIADRSTHCLKGRGEDACLTCRLFRAEATAPSDRASADRIAALEADVEAARSVDAVSTATITALRGDLVVARAALATMTEERNKLFVEAAPPRVRRPRAPRPGEVSLFDLVRPAAPSGDLVIPVTEDAPPQVRTAGRSCGCQRRGRHRRECSTRAGAAGGAE